MDPLPSPPPGSGSPEAPASALGRRLTVRPTGGAATAVAVGCAALIAVVGLLDHLTGYEVSFSIFYLLPVSVAAWYLGRTSGTLAATVSAAVWLLVDFTAGATYSNRLIPFSNAAVHLGFFLVTGWLVATLRVHLELERALARTDLLTGVMNGRAFHEEGRRLLELAGRMERPVTVLFIDADDFKAVNDHRGHSAGDRLLATVGRTLRESVRGTDLVARLGGDEFALLYPGLGADHTPEVTAKIREALLAVMAEGDWPVTFSIGAVTFVRPPASVDEAIASADGLMYAAKESGKDRVIYRVVG